MKKNLKIIIINLLLLLTFFVIIDIACFAKDLNYNLRSYVFKTPKTFFHSYFRTYKRIFYNKKNYDLTFIDGNGYNTFFRPPLNTDSNKPPILIMGCSYAFGSFLTVEQSFMGKLAQLTGRPIYNRALSARGVNEMLYQLSSDEFYSKIPKPEWFIYIFIPDHVRRTQIPCCVDDVGVYYNNKIKVIPNMNISVVYAVRNKIDYYSGKKYILHYNKIMQKIKQEAEKHWGDDVKFAFIFYGNDDIIKPEMKKSMTENGFIFLSLNDLTHVNLNTKEYKLDDNLHPSEAAWNILTPAIVDKLSL